jgi:hypothetical protein
VIPKERIHDTFPNESLFHIEVQESLYFNIVQFLTHGIIPSNLSSEGKTVFVHRAGPYTLIKNTLYKLTPDQRLKRCLEKREIKRVISALHEGNARDDYATFTTVAKI